MTTIVENETNLTCNETNLTCNETNLTCNIEKNTAEYLISTNTKQNEITIMSIELINFMCHSHFFIKFEKLVTCIGGRNGTGKSAVMIALGILFGQRVRTLERGKGYGSVIRNGCNEATINVRINNHRRHKLEKYGREIIISKVIGEKAAKIYISGIGGKMRHSKQIEVNGIINAYDLKFENPLNFLTQERSKRFLHTNDSGALYEFYYCGTKFKEVDNELDDCIKRLSEMKERLIQTEEQYKNHIHEREIKMKMLEVLNVDFEKRLKELEKEEKLRLIYEAVIEIDVSSMKINKYNKEIKELNKNIDETLEDIWNEESNKEIKIEIERLSIEKRGVKNDYNDYCEELKNKKRNEDGEGIEEAIKKLEELEKKINGINEEIINLKSYVETAESYSSKEKIKNEENKRRRQELKRQKIFLQENTGDLFGVAERLRKVSDMINKTKFKDEIIGPVCKYLRLKDMHWCCPVSIIIKNSLFNYIVFNKEDGKRLQEVFKQLGVNFTISQVSGRRGKIWNSNRKEWPTVLDMIECSHVEVMNYLVMMHEIERTILVDNREEAYKAIRRRIQNIECAYTKNGDRIRLTNGSLSDFRSRDKKYWFDNGTEQLKMIERELENIVDSNNAEQKYIELTESLSKKKKEIITLEEEKRWIEAKIEGLRSLKQEDRNEREKKIEELKRKTKLLEERLEQISKLHEIAENKKREIDERNENYRKLKEDNKIRREKEKEEFKKRSVFLEIKNAEEISKLRSLLKMHVMKIKTVIEEGYYDEFKNIESSDKQNKINTEELDEYNSEIIKKLFDEFEFQDGNFYLEKYKKLKIRKIAEILHEKTIIKEQQKETENMADRDTVIEQISALNIKIKRHFSLIDRYKSRIDEAQSAMEIRILKREQIKGIKTTETADAFCTFMCKNNYDGELKFDHENHKLDISVKVHSSVIAGSKDTLSGGERSYAAICFMVSLWISCNCPVKVLDEFDVFMDIINRRTTLKTLLDYFKSTRTQGILITPLNTEDIIDIDSQIVKLEKLHF